MSRTALAITTHDDIRQGRQGRPPYKAARQGRRPYKAAVSDKAGRRIRRTAAVRPAAVCALRAGRGPAGPGGPGRAGRAGAAVVPAIQMAHMSDRAYLTPTGDIYIYIYISCGGHIYIYIYIYISCGGSRHGWRGQNRGSSRSSPSIVIAAVDLVSKIDYGSS